MSLDIHLHQIFHLISSTFTRDLQTEIGIFCLYLSDEINTDEQLSRLLYSKKLLLEIFLFSIKMKMYNRMIWRKIWLAYVQISLLHTDLYNNDFILHSYRRDLMDKLVVHPSISDLKLVKLVF